MQLSPLDTQQGIQMADQHWHACSDGRSGMLHCSGAQTPKMVLAVEQFYAEHIASHTPCPPPQNLHTRCQDCKLIIRSS